MDILFLGITFGAVGKIILGLTVVSVHWKIVKEHKIDKKVIDEMRKERNLAFVAILLITLGYLLEVMFYGYIPMF